MADENEKGDEALNYDANAALAEISGMWLLLGRHMARVVENSNDWMDDSKAADEVMAWAARAEACLWRATGDADAIDAHRFIPELDHRAGQGVDA